MNIHSTPSALSPLGQAALRMELEGKAATVVVEISRAIESDPTLVGLRTWVTERLLEGRSPSEALALFGSGQQAPSAGGVDPDALDRVLAGLSVVAGKLDELLAREDSGKALIEFGERFAPFLNSVSRQVEPLHGDLVGIRSDLTRIADKVGARKAQDSDPGPLFNNPAQETKVVVVTGGGANRDPAQMPPIPEHSVNETESILDVVKPTVSRRPRASGGVKVIRVRDPNSETVPTPVLRRGPQSESDSAVMRDLVLELAQEVLARGGRKAIALGTIREAIDRREIKFKSEIAGDRRSDVWKHALGNGVIRFGNSAWWPADLAVPTEIEQIHALLPRTGKQKRLGFATIMELNERRKAAGLPIVKHDFRSDMAKKK